MVGSQATNIASILVDSRIAALVVALLGVFVSTTFECGPSIPSQGSYLVDPASSHMLVSKIKPCMSKYKLLIL
jgi:hypothetical protein